jgi:hypothetical protein
MSEEEIQIEKEFRIHERIAILCETRPPTHEETRMAIDEAYAWEKAWRSQSSSPANAMR